jgi:hypothetical protein
MSFTYPTDVASLLKTEGFGAEFIRVVMRTKSSKRSSPR